MSLMILLLYYFRYLTISLFYPLLVSFGLSLSLILRHWYA